MTGECFKDDNGDYTKLSLNGNTVTVKDYGSDDPCEQLAVSVEMTCDSCTTNSGGSGSYQLLCDAADSAPTAAMTAAAALAAVGMAGAAAQL